MTTPVNRDDITDFTALATNDATANLVALFVRDENGNVIEAKTGTVGVGTVTNSGDGWKGELTFNPDDLNIPLVDNQELSFVAVGTMGNVSSGKYNYLTRIQGGGTYIRIYDQQNSWQKGYPPRISGNWTGFNSSSVFPEGENEQTLLAMDLIVPSSTSRYWHGVFYNNGVQTSGSASTDDKNGASWISEFLFGSPSNENIIIAVYSAHKPTSLYDTIEADPFIFFNVQGGDIDTLEADSGSFSLSGDSASFTVITPANGGSYTMTGTAVNTIIVTQADSGLYAQVGTAIGTMVIAPIDSGAYTMVGTSASNVIVALAETGSFIQTGSTAGASLIATLDSGTYAMTGNAASAQINAPLDSGLYAMTGADATFSVIGDFEMLVAESGSFTMTGSESAFTVISPLESGAYSMAGSAISTMVSIQADGGSYAMTGTAIGALINVPLAPGEYELIGSSARLIYSGDTVSIITKISAKYLPSVGVQYIDNGVTAKYGGA